MIRACHSYMLRSRKATLTIRRGCLLVSYSTSVSAVNGLILFYLECRNLIHKMLQTDPQQRVSLSEIMNHPWITKGFNTPPENYLLHREPLQLPLDAEVIDKMTGFDFGTSEYITTQLTNVIQSDEYQRAVRTTSRKYQSQTPETERK